MNRTGYISSAILLIFSLMNLSGFAQGLSREQFIAQLLEKMTMDEKLGQLSLLNIDTEGINIREAIKAGQVGGIINATNPSEIQELQLIAKEQSRLGIPLLVSRDIIHGYQVVFPIPLGLAAGFNPELVEQMAAITAADARNDGINWTFSPMVDISRDPRWGRIAESFGEDTYLSSVMGAAMVRGYQQKKGDTISGIAACVKHFAGYGAAEGGRDYNSAEISEISLRQYYLPPFQACIEAGAPAVMAGFHDLNSVPVTGNSWLLTDLLRGEWAYDGFVVSDWASVPQLQVHGMARDDEEAVMQAFSAGCEMEMASRLYSTQLPGLIASGRISSKRLDAAVRRVLSMKYDLGLFESRDISEPARSRLLELAEEAALQSLVLLKNDSKILPFSPENKKILVVGPMANAPHDQLGTWSPDGIESEVITPLEYFRKEWPASCKLAYIPGLENTRDQNQQEFSKLTQSARKADLVLCFVGEEAILSGESHSRANLHLPGAQEEMIRSLRKAGTPVVVIVLAGRPLVLSSILPDCDAILYAWAPGTMGGPAIGKLLTGESSPSGKLPVTFPALEGQIPMYYNHRNTGKPALSKAVENLQLIPEKAPQFSVGNTSQYLDIGFEPLFHFGYGLSYGELSFGDLQLSSPTIGPEDSLLVTCKVTNSSSFEITEVIQLYIQDCAATLARPVRELKKFKRINFAPGETIQVNFSIHQNDLKYYHLDNQYYADEGQFNVFLGVSSETKLVQSFTFLKESSANFNETSVIPVKVAKTTQGYTFLRDGKEYFIKGAGLEQGNRRELAKRGGNSFRTWRTGYPGTAGKEALDEAYSLGLTVAMGIEIPAERHGFNFHDEAAVNQLLARIRLEVLSLKDHPALLCWLAGNELNLESKDSKVWEVVHRVVSMIHEIDPNHPVSTTLAGINKKDINLLEKYCPELDFYSFQLYGDIDNLPVKLKKLDWKKPFVITEWGATGHWEVPVTDWNRPLEQNSSQKAEVFLKRYQHSILADTLHCLGSYAFLWGQKQERTPTWYGLFLESGEITPAVEALQYAWTGQYPGNRCPVLESLSLDGRTANQSIRLEAGKEYPAVVTAHDPDADSIDFHWEIRPEVTEMSVGGDFEKTADILENLIRPSGYGKAVLVAPLKPGEYRLFVYLRDGHQHAATANIPFYVIDHQIDK